MHDDVNRGICDVISAEDSETNVILIHIEFFMITRARYYI
jgi:hypothetical protein